VVRAEDDPKKCRRPTIPAKEETGAMQPHRSTLLSLVQSLQDEGVCDEQVVELAAHLVNSGSVVLTGNFAGYEIDPVSGYSAPASSVARFALASPSNRTP
jgi:hypothetical protein